MTDTDTGRPAAGTGCPLGHGAAAGEAPPYVSYARMDALHELAQPRTDSPSELTFIVISHVKELLFRIIHNEVVRARDALREDQVGAACAAVARAVRTQRVLLDAWQVVTAMTPDEFMDFREILGEASGTQSFMYRTLECALGNKDPRMIGSSSPHLYPVLREELAGPSLYDEVLRHLARRGHAVPTELLERDLSGEHVFSPAVQDIWLAVYRDPGKYEQEHRLAESLTELSYQFSLWRSNHLLVVERMLGSKPGTGGTTGLDWLRSINEHRFFPELWQVRTLL